LELVRRFSDEVNDHTLFVGWHDYALAIGKMPIEAQAFQTWYFAVYQEKLDPEVDVTPYTDAFPNICSLSRSERKKALRSSIAHFRTDAEVMNDPRTENAPLISSVADRCRD
jgi:hypothetical protein